MSDKVKITIIVMTGLALLGSWYLGVDSIIQTTFLSLFLAAVAIPPIGAGLRFVGNVLSTKK